MRETPLLPQANGTLGGNGGELGADALGVVRAAAWRFEKQRPILARGSRQSAKPLDAGARFHALLHDAEVARGRFRISLECGLRRNGSIEG